MRTTIAAVCIFMFFTTVLLNIYQIGATSGALQGGYLMLTVYYSNAYGDRPISYIFESQKDRSEMGRAFLVQDTRSMRFFRSKLGQENVQEHPLYPGSWVVTGLSQRDFFGVMRSQEIAILVTGFITVAVILVPLYFDSKRP
jgi:hypothetical protein